MSDVWRFPAATGIDATIRTMPDGRWAWIYFRGHPPIQIAYDGRWVLKDYERRVDVRMRVAIEDYLNKHGVPPTKPSYPCELSDVRAHMEAHSVRRKGLNIVDGGMWLLRFADGPPVLRCLSPSRIEGEIVGFYTGDEFAVEAVPCGAQGIPLIVSDERATALNRCDALEDDRDHYQTEISEWRSRAIKAETQLAESRAKLPAWSFTHLSLPELIERLAEDRDRWVHRVKSWVQRIEELEAALVQRDESAFEHAIMILCDVEEPGELPTREDGETPRAYGDRLANQITDVFAARRRRERERWHRAYQADLATLRRERDVAKRERDAAEHRLARRGLTLRQVAEASARRLPAFGHKDPEGSDWSALEWAGAQGGEVGELVEAVGALLSLVASAGRAANTSKKVRRGDLSAEDARGEVGAELADVILYGFALAQRLGINIERALVEKFNAVSERIGSDVRLPEPVETPGYDADESGTCPDCEHTRADHDTPRRECRSCACGHGAHQNQYQTGKRD